MSRADLATRQQALVAALVTGTELPCGFDPMRVQAAANVLLNKRARDVAHAWPALRAGHGTRWLEVFSTFGAGRPPAGALLDGWHLACVAGAPTEEAAIELARCEVRWRLANTGLSRQRRMPAVRRTRTAWVWQLTGRVWVVRNVRRKRAVSSSPTAKSHHAEYLS
jgi:hypothetical protein